MPRRSDAPGHRRRFPALLVLAVLGSALAGPGPPGSRGSSPLIPRDATAAVSALRGSPGFYAPVISGGKTFPVARSNFLSLLEFPNNWHAPRLRLVSGTWRLIGVHEGIDITAERGTPIVSMAPGTVENLGWTFYSGTRVGVRGIDGLYYLYAHLSAIAPGIRVGGRVSAGTILGRVGNTGYGAPGHRDEFPPHLHFGLELGPEWINPYPTLVSLYAVMVRTTEERQARLDQLAAAGRRAAWESAAARAFMRLPWPAGE